MIMTLTNPPWSFLRALLALLPCAALGCSGRVERRATESVLLAPRSSSSAWLHPAIASRHQRRRRATPPWGSGGGGGGGGGTSSCWCSVTTSPVHSGSGGDGGGAPPNQGTGGRGGNGRRRRSADGGIGSLDGSDSDGSGGSHNNNNNNNNNASGSSASNSAEGGNEAKSALERQISQPAAARRESISEGLGKGVPSPRERLRLQQENLDMRWNMSRKANQTVCCRQCAGEGAEECRFCAGTGMFKIGSELMVDPASGRPPPCPVCRGKGEEVCSRCNGVGRIASWLFKSERRKWKDGDDDNFSSGGGRR